MLGLLLIRPSWDTDKPVWASNFLTLYARSQEWYWSESSTKKTTHRQTSLQRGCCVHHAGKKHGSGCCQCNYSIDIELQTTQSRARSSSVIIIHCSKNCMKIHIHYTAICSVTPTNAQGQHLCLNCALVIGILWRCLVKLPKQPFWIWGWIHKAQESIKADHRWVGCRRAYKICQDG